jgi:hypothetical protein
MTKSYTRTIKFDSDLNTIIDIVKMYENIPANSLIKKSVLEYMKNNYAEKYKEYMNKLDKTIQDTMIEREKQNPINRRGRKPKIDTVVNSEKTVPILDDKVKTAIPITGINREDNKQ